MSAEEDECYEHSETAVFMSALCDCPHSPEAHSFLGCEKCDCEANWED
jgi:hypothetical protein